MQPFTPLMFSRMEVTKMIEDKLFVVEHDNFPQKERSYETYETVNHWKLSHLEIGAVVQHRL